MIKALIRPYTANFLLTNLTASIAALNHTLEATGMSEEEQQHVKEFVLAGWKHSVREFYERELAKHAEMKDTFAGMLLGRNSPDADAMRETWEEMISGLETNMRRMLALPDIPMVMVDESEVVAIKQRVARRRRQEAREAAGMPPEDDEED